MPAAQNDALPNGRSHLTLALTTLLHAFTHAYGVMLVPLYLLIQKDLALDGVGKVSLIVTIYGFVYAIGSFLAGMLADHFNRKLLLGLGLIGNAMAILLMGVTHSYTPLIFLAVLAGVAGTIFHPAANARCPRIYPKNPAMAIGMLGIGSGIGFFAGPQFAGWRAKAGGWTLGGIADWQRPCVELGIAGLIFGAIFLLVAREARVVGPPGAKAVGKVRTPLGKDLRNKVIAIAAVLCMRDFAGLASLSLASLYFQKALGWDTQKAGFVLGATMLVTIVVNPTLVLLTPGRRRLPVLACVLILGGGLIAAAPFVSAAAVVPLLCVYQVCHLGSYALSESGMLERVNPSVRGRVIGLFLMIAGTVAATGPWVMGFWTDHLGDAAKTQAGFTAPFAFLGVLLFASSGGALLIARLGRPPLIPVIDPREEITPRTMEAVG